MTRHRALTSTFRSVIALFAAVVLAVVGATALPAAALAGGHGHAKGHQGDRAAKGGDRAQKSGKASASGKTHKSGKASPSGKTSRSGKSQSGQAHEPAKAPKSHPTQDSTSAQGGASSNGKSDQSQGKGGSGAAGSKPTGDSSDNGDPKGNNGTIKLAGFGGTNGPGHSDGDGSTPKHPSNDPHLPCTFSVEWYGFDSGVTSEVMFEQHAPTPGGSAHHDSVLLDADSHSGGGSTAGYDGVATYDLDWDGEPHAKHGYHVKLTTSTPYSQGADTKHKVFWVEPCEDEEVPDDEGEVPDDDDENPDEDDENPPHEENENPNEDDEDNDGVQDEVDDVDHAQATSTTQVLGVQASTGANQGAQPAPAEVPTAVDSGLSGEEWSRSVLPLLAVLLGLATTFVAVARRRASVQVDTRD